MLQAWITAPLGSLYFAAPATVYNLETLRMHTRALRERGARTCLTLSLGGTLEGRVAARVSALVDELRREGIHVRLLSEAEGVVDGGSEAGERGRDMGPAALTPLRRSARASRGRRPRDMDARRGATSGSRG